MTSNRKAGRKIELSVGQKIPLRDGRECFVTKLLDYGAVVKFTNPKRSGVVKFKDIDRDKLV